MQHAWGIERLNDEVGHDAGKRTTTALSHPQHVWIHLVVGELPVAASVDVADAPDGVAREAVQLREHAPPAAEEQPRRPDAALGAARDHQVVLDLQPVVQLPEGVARAEIDLLRGVVHPHVRQVLQVYGHPAGAPGVVLEAVRAGPRAGLHSVGGRAAHRQLDLVRGADANHSHGPRRDVYARVLAPAGVVVRGFSGSDDGA
mmetsp:Transcript_98377/g.300828  ORF Transcript_98377/g.300828 Transcript_98377/m.300828 type:complete len:202 (-) Transcript_98377:37-642(-)